MGKAVLTQPKLTKSLKKQMIGLACIAILPSVAYADKTDTIVNLGDSRIASNKQAQQRIDKLSEQTDKIISKYNQQKKAVENLKVYNDRMRRTLEAQNLAMQKLERSIEEASLIERQIVPLMVRMIAGLERFVNEDMPFRLAERQARVERIKSYLNNANISAAERFRQVLEAYSIENAYGTTIAAYSEELEFEGQKLNVTVLQVGRTALYFQTGDGKVSGTYDKKAKAWVELPSKYNENIAYAIKVAQKKVSPDLMDLPLPAPEDI